MSRPARVLYLVMAPDASAWWRVIRPVERLKEAGYLAEWRENPDDVDYRHVARNFDAVVLTRLYWRDHAAGAALVGRMKDAGLTVLYEVDDDWYSPGSSERLHVARPSAGSVEYLEGEREHRTFALSLVDGVIASSDGLAEVVARHTDAPVRVVPNAIDAEWWADRLRGAYRMVPSPSVGWLGGSRLEEDLAPVAEAWGRIARRYPAAHFVVTGDAPGGVAAHVPPERVWPIPWQKVDALPAAWANVDIACCAVADNAWNRCRTPIKVWEATLSGAAVIASPTLYGGVIDWGLDGLLAETPDEWEEALGLLLDDAAICERFRAKQRERVYRDHRLWTHLHRWTEAWAALIGQSAMVAV